MENEVSLPKNTIKQTIQKKLPSSLKSSANGISQLVADLTLDFITILSEKAYEECLASGKKTLMPDHVISAMRSSNIPMDPEEITAFLADLGKIKAVRTTESTPKEKFKLKKHGMSDDQLLEEQEKLLASAQETLINQKTEDILEEDKEEYD